MTPREVKELLTEICTLIVTLPDMLDVRVEEEPPACTFSIECSGADVGKLIGKGGGHWRAMESLLTAWGHANGYFPFLNKIGRLDDLDSQPYRRYQARQDWPKQKVCEIAWRMAVAAFGGIRVLKVDASDQGEFTELVIRLSKDADAEVVRSMLPSFNSIVRAVGSSLDRSMHCKIITDHAS